MRILLVVAFLMMSPRFTFPAFAQSRDLDHRRQPAMPAMPPPEIMNIMTKMQTGQSISEADQKALLEWGEQMQKQAQAAQDLDTPIQKPADATPDIDQRLEASQQRLDKIGEEIEALGKVIEKNADVWRQEGEVLVEKKQAKVSELSARANMNAPKEERNALVAALEQAQQDFNEGMTRSTQKFEERNRPTMEKIQALQGEQSKEYALYTTLLQEKLTGRPQAPRAQADSPPKKVAGASSDERREGRVDATGVKESAQTFAQPPPAVVTVKEDGVIPPDVLLDPFGHDGEDQAPGTKGLESWTLSLVSRSPFKNPDTETSRNFRGTIDTSGSASIRVDDKGNLSGSGYLSGQFSYQGEFLNDKGLWEFHSDGLSSAGPFSVTGKRDGNDLIFSFEGTIPFGDGGGWDAESFSGWNTAIERKEGATSKRHTGQLAWHVGPGVGLIDFTTTFTLSGGRNVVPFEVAETKLPADRRPPWKLKLDSECQYAGGGWSKTEGHVDFWLPKQGNRVYAEGSMHTTVNFMGTVSEMSELLIIDGIVQDCMLISKPRHATQSFEMEGQVLQMAADYGRGILYEQDMGEVQIVLTNGAVFVQEDQVPGAAAKTVWTLTGPDKVDPELFENELRDPGCPERFRTDVEYTINADLASSELNVGVKIYFDKGIIVATPEVTRRMVPSLRAGRAYNVEALHAEEGTYEFVTVTDQQLSELKGKWEREIEKRWNDQYRIQCGDKAERKPFTPRFDAQFVNNREDANYHVTVWPGYERANVLNWYAEQRDATAPHEFGHMINLSDEYKMLSECPGRQVFNDDTLMGSGNTVKSRHFKQLADWLRSHTGCDCMVVEQEKEKLHADKK